MQQCPKCGSPRIHRSRSRNLVERLRKTVTSTRPHRCHACGWRGWGVESHDEPSLIDAPGPTRAALDLSVIDAFAARHAGGEREREGEGRPGRRDPDAHRP